MENKEIATIARTTEILEKYDLTPKKGFGQNFIIEPEVVRSIAQLSKAEKNNCVLEIGPGIGALTEQLAKRAKRVEAYEIDVKLKEVLEESLADYKNVTIHWGDFLETDLKEEVRKLDSENPVIFCANLPYYVTTPILFHIINSEIEIENMTFMVQKEMADRFSAKPNSKDYNDLSVLLQFLFDIKTVKKISPSVFIPRPKVDSIVIQFTPKEHENLDFTAFSKLVTGCFVQRRKTIYNNLKEYCQNAEKAEQILEMAEIDKQRRAESLEIRDFIRLYEVENEISGKLQD